MSRIKIRMLVAIFILMAITFAYKGNDHSRRVIQPLIDYTITKNYDVSGWAMSWRKRLGGNQAEMASSYALQIPCQNAKIARHFGWYYNPRTQSQAFNPGVVLKIGQNVPVYPILRGAVREVSIQENRYQVVIQHGDQLQSTIRGLQEVLVKEGQLVEQDSIIGRGHELLYVELKNKEGPVNIEGLLIDNETI